MACNTSSDDGTNNSNQENEKNKEENLANDDFPVTLTNAGREISFDAPPERVVALYQQEAEMMAALDLEDKLEGYSIKSANTLEKYEEKLADMLDLGENDYPSKEVSIDTYLDFVIC